MLQGLTVTLALAVAATAAYDGSRQESKNIQWTGGPFDWPCAMTKSLFKSNGKYNQRNIIATRGVIFKDDVFLALPRYKAGVPATLARMPLKGRGSPGVGGSQPLLSAFPCWTVQEEGNCNSLQNVVDVNLDVQDILWVLDTGIVNSLEEPIRRCPPKVVAFNVKSGKMVKSVDLSGLVTPLSRLQYVVGDYSADGRAFIYVSDAATGSILVYDVTSGRGYRVVLPKPVTMGLPRRDVLYMTLLHRPDGSSCLLFSYLSGSRVFSIKTEYLQNGPDRGRIHDLGLKPRKMVFLGSDNGNALFFRFEGDSDVYRWDCNTCFSPGNFQKVYRGSECLLPTHVMPDYKRGRMRVLESNFPDFTQGMVGCGAIQGLNFM